MNQHASFLEFAIKDNLKDFLAPLAKKYYEAGYTKGIAGASIQGNGAGVWVKASLDNLPKLLVGGYHIYYYIRYNDGKHKEVGDKNLIKELIENGWIDVEYLDENAVVQGNDWISEKELLNKTIDNLHHSMANAEQRGHAKATQELLQIIKECKSESDMLRKALEIILEKKMSTFNSIAQIYKLEVDEIAKKALTPPQSNINL